MKSLNNRRQPGVDLVLLPKLKLKVMAMVMLPPVQIPQ